MANAKAFLLEAFPRDLLSDDERVLVSKPGSFRDRETGQRKNFHKQLYFHPRSAVVNETASWHYCVSTVAANDKPQRRLQDVRHAFVLPCDDIGTKAVAPPIEPSYILETSPGNYQYGYFIDPFDVGRPAGAAYFDACLLGMARSGYNDFGCRSASRVVKLPGALHKTGFVSRLVDFQPARSWDLEALMAAMGVRPALDAVHARGVRKPGRHTELDDVCDPIYDWLVGEGLVGAARGQWVEVTCPWAHLHTHPEDSLAGYSPLDYVDSGRAFNCFHGHGADHGLQQFMAWVIEQGGPSTDLSFERMRMIQQCLR